MARTSKRLMLWFGWPACQRYARPTSIFSTAPSSVSMDAGLLTNGASGLAPCRAEAAIADVRDAPCGQSRAKLGAISVSECVIHDRRCQAVMLNQDECVANGSRCGRQSTRVLKGASNVHSNEHFVLNHEDRAAAQCGKFHGGTFARLSANARGGLFDAGRRVPSRRSILSAQQA